MPYRSDQQRRWAHTTAGTKALGGKAKVAEWDAASRGKKMPERAAPRTAKGKPSMGGKGRRRG